MSEQTTSENSVQEINPSKSWRIKYTSKRSTGFQIKSLSVRPIRSLGNAKSLRPQKIAPVPSVQQENGQESR